MATPEYYPTRLEAIQGAVSGLNRGEVIEFGRSAGGRPLWAVAYGAKEERPRLANHSSALAARQPEAFFGAEPRERQVLMIVSAIHGGEMESIAGVLNLIAVMETGADLKGQPWPGLAAMAARLRLVIVPCLNPDGRARIPVDDPTIWTEDEEEKHRHGLLPDGDRIGWPACKIPHPRDPAHHSFLGSYFNDAGVNPLHGVFLSPEVAPETHAALALALDETPDCTLDLHSCGSGPFFLLGDIALPESYSRRSYYIEGFARGLLHERLNIHRRWTTPGIEGALTINSAYFHLCGALPLLFEGAHGAQTDNPYTHAQIVDTYLTVFEAVMTIGVRERFRPRA